VAATAIMADRSADLVPYLVVLGLTVAVIAAVAVFTAKKTKN